MIITENGLYSVTNKVKGFGGATSMVYVSGAFGTATATLVYLNELGNEVVLENGVLVIDTQNAVVHGVDRPIFVRVALADGATAIVIEVRGKV